MCVDQNVFGQRHTQVTLVSALAHGWYHLCKPACLVSKASQHGTRKTAAGRLDLRVGRRQPAGKSTVTATWAARAADRD